jgi:inner membrane protein
MGRLGYLLHHRGHTHTVLFALAAALLMWGVAVALRRGEPPGERRAMLGVALAGTLSHIALDYTNSYGVHPFWPVVNRWFYGDAVFIVEPWLWIAALAPLIGVARSVAGRVLLGLGVVAILAAVWLTGQASRGAAIAVTVGAAAWLALVLAAPRARRVALGVAAWVGFEGVSFAASSAAHARVRAALAPAAPLDVALTPEVANPLCFRALVVTLDGATYRVAPATVAPFPGLRDVHGCGPPRAIDDADMTSPAPSATRAVRWGWGWSAPSAELVALARSNCEVAAALRFIRVPVWDRLSGGTVRLTDVRYGRGGFAEVVTSGPPATCPRAVPPWEPPRRDVIGTATE